MFASRVRLAENPETTNEHNPQITQMTQIICESVDDSSGNISRLSHVIKVVLYVSAGSA